MTRILDFIFVLAYRTFSKKDLLLRCVMYMSILIFLILTPVTFLIVALFRDESHTLCSRVIFYIILFCIMILCYFRYNIHKDIILDKYYKKKINRVYYSNIFLIIILLTGIVFCFLSMIWVSQITSTYNLDGYLYNLLFKRWRS